MCLFCGIKIILLSANLASRTLDPTRPINENDGWEHVLTDLTTVHDYTASEVIAKSYEKLPDLPNAIVCDRSIFLPAIDHVEPAAKHISGAPLMCTEFGGLNIAAPKQDADSKDWGYITADNANDLVKRVEGQISAFLMTPGLSALVYTQLSDIEQEVNGLYTYDRKPKVEPAKMKAVFEKAEELYFANLKKQGISF